MYSCRCCRKGTAATDSFAQYLFVFCGEGFVLPRRKEHGRRPKENQRLCRRPFRFSCSSRQSERPSAYPSVLMPFSFELLFPTSFFLPSSLFILDFHDYPPVAPPFPGRRVPQPSRAEPAYHEAPAHSQTLLKGRATRRHVSTPRPSVSRLGVSASPSVTSEARLFSERSHPARRARARSPAGTCLHICFFGGEVYGASPRGGGSRLTCFCSLSGAWPRKRQLGRRGDMLVIRQLVCQAATDTHARMLSSCPSIYFF